MIRPPSGEKDLASGALRLRRDVAWKFLIGYDRVDVRDRGEGVGKYLVELRRVHQDYDLPRLLHDQLLELALAVIAARHAVLGAYAAGDDEGDVYVDVADLSQRLIARNAYVVPVEHSADRVHYRLVLLYQLHRYIRPGRCHGEPFVRQKRRQLQHRRAGVKEEGTAGLDKIDRRESDLLLRVGVFGQPEIESVLHRRGDEFHRPRAAPDLYRLALILEVFDVAPEGHARHIREHELKLVQRDERLRRQKTSDRVSSVSIHGYNVYSRSKPLQSGIRRGVLYEVFYFTLIV